MIKECTFDRKDCGNETYFKPYYSRQFGKCYTFSSDKCG